MTTFLRILVPRPLRIDRRGFVLDDDLDGAALVFIEHVVDGAHRACSDAARAASSALGGTAAAPEAGPQHDDCDDDQRKNDETEGTVHVPSSRMPPSL